MLSCWPCKESEKTHKQNNNNKTKSTINKHNNKLTIKKTQTHTKTTAKTGKTIKRCEQINNKNTK